VHCRHQPDNESRQTHLGTWRRDCAVAEVKPHRLVHHEPPNAIESADGSLRHPLWYLHRGEGVDLRLRGVPWLMLPLALFENFNKYYGREGIHLHPSTLSESVLITRFLCSGLQLLMNDVDVN